MTSEQGERQLVVVGVDGSAESVTALAWAGRYAEATGAEIRAVLAWRYPGAAGEPGPPGISPLRPETEQKMSAALAEAVGKVFPDPAAARVQSQVSYGHPAQVLIDESKHADLLVVGSRGHGAFTGMLVGSVSIHCVTGASCPVTVVHGAEEKS